MVGTVMERQGTGFAGDLSSGQPPGFSDLAVAHFHWPRKVGGWVPGTPAVGTGWAGDPVQGDLLRLQIQVVDATIVDSRFKAFGSAWTIAVGSFMAEQMVGWKLERVDSLDDREIVSALELPPLRIRSAVLAVSACQAAVANFRTQQPPGVVQK